MELSRTCLLGGASILGDITQRDRDFMVFQKGSENALGLGEKKKKPEFKPWLSFSNM